MHSNDMCCKPSSIYIVYAICKEYCYQSANFQWMCSYMYTLHTSSQRECISCYQPPTSQNMTHSKRQSPSIHPFRYIQFLSIFPFSYSTLNGPSHNITPFGHGSQSVYNRYKAPYATYTAPQYTTANPNRCPPNTNAQMDLPYDEATTSIKMHYDDQPHHSRHGVRKKFGSNTDGSDDGACSSSAADAAIVTVTNHSFQPRKSETVIEEGHHDINHVRILSLSLYFLRVLFFSCLIFFHFVFLFLSFFYRIFGYQIFYVFRRFSFTFVNVIKSYKCVSL